MNTHFPTQTNVLIRAPILHFIQQNLTIYLVNYGAKAVCYGLWRFMRYTEL